MTKPKKEAKVEHESLYTHDLIIIQLGDIKDIKSRLVAVEPNMVINVVPDFMPTLFEKYKIKDTNGLKKLSDIKNMDFTQEAFYMYFESIFNGLRSPGFDIKPPSALIIERSFLDILYLLKAKAKLLYESNSILLCNYRLYDLIKNIIMYSFVRGLINIPNLKDKNCIFYDKDFLVAAKNYLSYSNYVSLSFAHTLPINYEFYFTEEGNTMQIIDYQVENNAIIDINKINLLINTLEKSEIKTKFQKFVATVPPGGNLLGDNFVWGQILPTLLHFYTTKLSLMTKKEKNILQEIVEMALFPENSAGFLTLEAMELVQIAKAVRNEKQKVRIDNMPVINTSYLN